jgi:hypothetical protein
MKQISSSIILNTMTNVLFKLGGQEGAHTVPARRLRPRILQASKPSGHVAYVCKVAETAAFGRIDQQFATRQHPLYSRHINERVLLRVDEKRRVHIALELARAQ